MAGLGSRGLLIRNLLIAFGIHIKVYCELLVYWVGDSEGEASWSEFL